MNEVSQQCPLEPIVSLQPDAGFNDWWNADVLTQTNPFREDTPAYWAWEGWIACKLRRGMPAGWREVPLEPTKAMLDAADYMAREHYGCEYGMGAGFAGSVWRAMVDEALNPPIKQPPNLLAALTELAHYADTCELLLRETHPGKADFLRKKVAAAKAAMDELQANAALSGRGRKNDRKHRSLSQRSA